MERAQDVKCSSPQRRKVLDIRKLDPGVAFTYSIRTLWWTYCCTWGAKVALNWAWGPSDIIKLATICLLLTLPDVLLYGIIPAICFASVFCASEVNAWRHFSGTTVPIVPKPNVSYIYWRSRGHGINPGSDRCLAEYAQYINGLAARYGDCFVARGFMGERRLTVLSLAGVQRMFTGNSANYDKVPALRKLFYDLVGKYGLLTSSVSQHSIDRKILQPAFHHGALVQMNEIFHEHAYALVQKWTALRDDADARGDVHCPVDIKKDTTTATLDIIASAAFSYANNDAQDKATVDAFLCFAHPENPVDTAVVPVFLVAVPRFIRILLPFSFLQRRRKAAREIKDGTSKIVNRRLKTPNKTIVDLLDRLIDAKTRLPPGAIGDHTLTFLAAGHATTAISFVWALVALSTRPRLLQRLRVEMEMACPNGRDPQFDLMKLNRLEVLDAFVKEVLRFYPPFPAIARCAVQDDVICGHKIKGGTRVSIPLAAIMRDKRIYGDDAEVFNVDRWIAAPGKLTPPPNAFLSFAYGPRGCIGNQFALYEMKVLLQEVLWGTVIPRLRAGCEYNAIGGVLTVQFDSPVDLVRMSSL